MKQDNTIELGKWNYHNQVNGIRPSQFITKSIKSTFGKMSTASEIYSCYEAHYLSKFNILRIY